jgi:hypothetical protein
MVGAAMSVAGLLIAVGVAGCTAAAPPTRQAAVRDSAGIHVVENPAPADDIDDAGRLWARVFPDTLSRATWDIFGPEGRLAGTAELPADLNIRQIHAGHVLALTRGELGEPLIELYRLSDSP